MENYCSKIKIAQDFSVLEEFSKRNHFLLSLPFLFLLERLGFVTHESLTRTT